MSFARRLSRVIAELPGSDVALAKALAIDRRRIHNLRHFRENATISMGELDRLDAHLVGRNGIVGAISMHHSLFATLARCRDIRFLLGTRLHRGIGSVSVFDLEAALGVQEKVTQARLAAQLPLHAFHTSTAAAGSPRSVPPAQPQNRFSALLSLGSPRSNPFAEAMLAPVTGEGTRSPIWLGFPDVTEGKYGLVRRCEGPHRSIGVDRRVFKGDAKRSHGLVVAYRCAKGVLRICCLGTNGQATLACVQVLPQATLDVADNGERALLMVVEANSDGPDGAGAVVSRNIVLERFLPMKS